MTKLILYLKLYYYSFLDWLDDTPSINTPNRVIVRSQQNIKLMRGVKKLVRRLRSMSPSERTQHENLLSQEPYQKTKQEIREEMRVRHKVMKNPTLKTEDDLVMKVVQMAPAYAKEQEVKEIRRQLTACLQAASREPSNPSHGQEAQRLKAKLSVLKAEIARIKNG